MSWNHTPPPGTAHGLNCEECGSPTDVIDSRGTRAGVRRRRQCENCKTRFTTYETREAIDPQTQTFRERWLAGVATGAD